MQRLRNEVDAAILRKAFSNFGTVYDVRIVQGIRHGRTKRFAFCDMESRTAAESAIDMLNGSVVLGSPALLVAHSTDSQANRSSNDEPDSILEHSNRMNSRIAPSQFIAIPAGNRQNMGGIWPYPGEINPLIPTLPDFDSPDMITTLYIRSLPTDCDEYWLFHCFGQFGSIVASKVLRNNEDGKSRGEGFVEFYSRRDAEIAMVRCQGACVGDTRGPLRITWAHRQLHLCPVSCGALWPARPVMADRVGAVGASAPFGNLPISPLLVEKSACLPTGPQVGSFYPGWPRPPYLSYPSWQPQINPHVTQVNVPQYAVRYPELILPIQSSVNTHYSVPLFSARPDYSVQISYQDASKRLLHTVDQQDYEEEAKETQMAKVEDGYHDDDDDDKEKDNEIGDENAPTGDEDSSSGLQSLARERGDDGGATPKRFGLRKGQCKADAQKGDQVHYKLTCLRNEYDLSATAKLQKPIKLAMLSIESEPDAEFSYKRDNFNSIDDIRSQVTM